MAKEIERKFLVKGNEYKEYATAYLCRQGYIANNLDAVVRVRVYGELAFLTVKGRTIGLSRDEYEYGIPVEDANEMLDKLCKDFIVEKYRYELDYEGKLWTVDEFFGQNWGLCIAEIELEDEQQDFVKPEWLGEEITYDYRFSGSNLAIKPFVLWD